MEATLLLVMLHFLAPTEATNNDNAGLVLEVGRWFLWPIAAVLLLVLIVNWLRWTRYDRGLNGRARGSYRHKWFWPSQKIEKYGLDVCDLHEILDPRPPSVTLQWSPPRNSTEDDDVVCYHIRYRRKNDYQYHYISPVDGGTQQVMFTCDGSGEMHSLDHWTGYVFQVRAEGQHQLCGEWSEVKCSIDLMVPQQVQGLCALLDHRLSFFPLKWCPPANCTQIGDVVNYHVRYKKQSDTNFRSFAVCRSKEETKFQITCDGEDKKHTLTPFTHYEFQVRAEGRNEQYGKWTTVEYFIDQVIPLPVEGLRALLNPRLPSVTLQWDPPSNCTDYGDVAKYQVRYKCMSSFFHRLTDLNDTHVEFTCNGTGETSSLKLSTRYVFQVRAEGRNGQLGEWSGVECFIAPTIPEPVQGLQAIHNPRRSSITLKWEPPGNCTEDGDIFHYYIRYREKLAPDMKVPPIAVRGTIQQALFTCNGKGETSSLKHFTEYEFQVRAEGQNLMCGKWSGVECFIDLLKPQPVRGLCTYLNLRLPSVTLKWDPPTNCTEDGDVVHYHIRYRKKFDRVDQLVCPPPADDDTLQVEFTCNGNDKMSSLTPLTLYSFQVRAEGRFQQFGRWSGVECFVALMTPQPVQGLRTVKCLQSSSMKLEWIPPPNCTANGDITSYHIRYKKESDADDQYIHLPPLSNDSLEKVFLTHQDTDTTTRYMFQVRPEGRHQQFGEWSGVECIVDLVVPQPVQDLDAIPDPRLPSVTLKWSGDMVRYRVRYRKKLGGDDQYLDLPPVPSGTMKMMFTCSVTDESSLPEPFTHGMPSLTPLASYVFQVRAEGHSGQLGEWREVECFVDWHCRLPSCTLNRIVVGLDPYDFCSVQHKMQFDLQHCLFPGCTISVDKSSESIVTPKQSHFCSREHYARAKDKGMAFLISVPETSKEYGDVQERFERSWCPTKGRCPTIQTILAIVNPSVEEKFLKYRDTLLFCYQNSEMHFHGTKLSCLIHKYQLFCSSSDCGVCGIVKRGFLSDCISRGRWQRLGKAFYFAPNSSKSHDYPLGIDLVHRGLLLCEVAPGVKYEFYPCHYSTPVPKEPPEGYNSLYGKSKSVYCPYSDLNYDELALFNEDAILPHYLILYD